MGEKKDPSLSERTTPELRREPSPPECSPPSIVAKDIADENLPLPLYGRISSPSLPVVKPPSLSLFSFIIASRSPARDALLQLSSRDTDEEREGAVSSSNESNARSDCRPPAPIFRLPLLSRVRLDGDRPSSPLPFRLPPLFLLSYLPLIQYRSPFDHTDPPSSTPSIRSFRAKRRAMMRMHTDIMKKPTRRPEKTPNPATTAGMLASENMLVKGCGGVCAISSCFWFRTQ
mmetsp:Transcript_21150/g.54986  ORF Transcript_21150/g.54986 Transcript_21150/m.54986 type:complete len:231 (+) Transcript_21150:451-1143(+)